MDVPVHYERRGRVATITLDRAHSGNVIDEPMASALREACQRAVEDDDAHVVILESAGLPFCAGGANLRDLPPPVPASMAALRVASAVAAIPRPTIALIAGDALGQGLELALACDLRVASDAARFALDQVPRGFMPWDGGTQRLPRLIGRGVAVDMILTGRAIGAQEALAIGLLSEVAPTALVREKGHDMAEKLAVMAPIAASYAKEAVWKGMDMPLDQGIRLEADLALLLHTTRDRAEGLSAFLQRRRPTFTGQ